MALTHGWFKMAYIPQQDWFQQVAEGSYSNYSSIEKFGENPEITTTTDPEDVWDGGGIYTFSSSADINKIASSDNSDTVDVQILGLDTNWAEVTQTVTLTGQTPATLSTSLIRVYRMVNIGSTDIAGTVYLALSTTTWTTGVPDTATEIRAQIVNGNNQTLMGIYTVPAGKTGYFWGGYVAMSSGGVQNQSATFTWRARAFGGVFSVKSKILTAGNGRSSWDYTYKIPVVLPEKTDVLIRCDEVTATMGVSGGFTVLLKDN